ncbi:MAG: Na+/H+ antiporter NhaA [Bacteroidales bacterium]|nr:Na+/H+ antiporter NhaA [Bacteroidales bacterium]
MTKLFNEFFNSEKAGGIILVIATVLSLLIANSALQDGYIQFWEFNIASHSLVHWINDGLMAIFFLLIGLELEREIYVGELADIKNASLPIFGAIGGMLVPAGLFLLFNYGLSTQSGIGIPMATDIAFAVGILSLLGNRVPLSLKVFIIALAIIDDLGAIIIIAIFYTTTLSLTNLFIALGVFALLIVLNRLKVRNLIPYLIGGLIMWYFMLHSGVHATITGVLLAFAIPFGDGSHKSPSYVLQHFLHKPVAFIILPLFAIANTSIAIGADWMSGLASPSSLGIISGLLIGKPMGIFLFTLLAVTFGLSRLPEGLRWIHLIGAGFLAGIGFTMSIFITILAFDQPELVSSAKIAILAASVIAGTTGFIWLKNSLRPAVE